LGQFANRGEAAVALLGHRIRPAVDDLLRAGIQDRSGIDVGQVGARLLGGHGKRCGQLIALAQRIAHPPILRLGPRMSD
jgi:hypothetical protein